MKIYTRTGDDGETALFGGERVDKNHVRVQAYGSVDEANASIGVCASLCTGPFAELQNELHKVMSDLFDLGAELATPPAEHSAEVLSQRLDSRIDDARIAELEAAIDATDDVVPPLQSFVLPTGTLLASHLHVARTAVRRAEREVCALAKLSPVRGCVLRYLNRLSDCLFAWSRLANKVADVGDVPWLAKKAER